MTTYSSLSLQLRPGKADPLKFPVRTVSSVTARILPNAVHLLAASKHGDNALISAIQSQDVLNRQGGI
jgi:hypothetical protein